MPAQSPAQRLLIARMVWVSFVIAPIVYLFIAHTIRQGRAPTWETDSLYRMMWVFFAASSVFLVGVQRVLHSAVFGPRTARETDEEKRSGLAVSEMIFRAACLESISIFGLILAILFGRFLDAVAFAVATIVLMPLIFPRASDSHPPTDSGGPWYVEGNR